MYFKQEVNLEEAKAAISEGRIVYTSGDSEDRGIGKTTNIVAYSIWANKPIMVETNSRIKLIREISKDAIIYYIPTLTSESSFPNGVLIDDGLSQSGLDKLISILGKDKISGFMTVQGVQNVN